MDPVKPGSDGLPPAIAREPWQRRYPYQWEKDDLVSRRELLRLSVWTSGTLLGTTILFGILGRALRLKSEAVQRIARVDEVPVGGALYFHYPEPDDEAMLLHLPGGRFVAYDQKCTHLSCAVYWQPDRDRLFCPCHDGVFNPQTGDPIAGPPQRRLRQIQLRREGDVLYAVGRTP